MRPHAPPWAGRAVTAAELACSELHAAPAPARLLPPSASCPSSWATSRADHAATAAAGARQHVGANTRHNSSAHGTRLARSQDHRRDASASPRREAAARRAPDAGGLLRADAGTASRPAQPRPLWYSGVGLLSARSAPLPRTLARDRDVTTGLAGDHFHRHHRDQGTRGPGIGDQGTRGPGDQGSEIGD